MFDKFGRSPYMGEGGFCWFIGIVEDIHDPMEAGRVKVRCFGYHSKDKQFTQTEHLPWAMVMLPTSSASVSGIGCTPHGILQGSQVVGFFQDGSDAQFPMVVGTIPSIPSHAPDPSKGFNDPGGEYPREDRLNSPDVNQLAGSSHAESSFRTERTENLREDIESASGEIWSERDSNALPTYPDNRVIETKSGHIIELDDSEDSERIHIRHKKGTYIEIHSDGSVSEKIVGTNQSIIERNRNILVGGEVRINAESNADIIVQEKIHLKVNEGNIQIEVLNGDADVSINGNATLNITGNMETSVDGNMTTNIKGNSTTNVDGEWKTIASGKARLNGSRVDLN